jgi:hypothetical protein
MLAALEEFDEVVALRDKYPEDIKDVELFRELRNLDYVFITNDARQRTRADEVRAIKEAGLTALWLGPFWRKKEFWDQAKWIIQRWRTIDGYVSGVAKGTCAEVKENGKSRPFLL